MSDTGCKQCLKKNTKPSQIGIAILGFYIIFSSIYGTKILIEHLINLIKH